MVWVQPNNATGPQDAAENHETNQHHGADQERNVAQSVPQKSNALTNHAHCCAFFLLSL